MSPRAERSGLWKIALIASPAVRNDGECHPELVEGCSGMSRPSAGSG